MENKKISLRSVIILFIILFSGWACDKSGIPTEFSSGSGDLIIKNVSIIDPVGEKILPGMDIIIRAGIIESVVTSGSDPSIKTDLVIDGKDFYAVPGFVNSHTHLWQHLSRSVSPSEQLQQWIPKVYKPAFHMTDEEFYELNLAASCDALLHGITTVLDWTANADEGKVEQVLNAMISSGLGGAVAWPHTTVFLPYETEKREFERVRSFARMNNRDLFAAHLPPERIPIPLLFDGILLARETGAPIAEHIMENVQCQRDWLSTVKAYLAKQGDSLQANDRKYLEKIARSPVPPSIDAIAAMSQNARIVLDLIQSRPKGEADYNNKDISFLKELAKHAGPSYIPFLEHLGAYENGYVSVHSSLLRPEDIAIYQKHNVIINHNPESNVYLASGIAPISSFLLKELTVSLGTDGAASNDRIDMLAAMRLMSHLQKVVALNVPLTEELNSWGILRIATISGAKALKQEDRIGSIEEGKEADIILIHTGSFEMQPVTEHPSCIADLLVNSAESKDIHSVITDGMVRVWDGKLVNVNEEDLARSVSEIRKAAISRVSRSNSGRSWIEVIDVTDPSIPVVRYRAMYPNYLVDLDITNSSDIPLAVTVVISDAEKAGNNFYADETKKRFPSESYDPSRIKESIIVISPGESLFLDKEFGGDPMKFVMSKEAGSIDSFLISLPDDPEWEWALRANIYLETGMVNTISE